MEDRINSIIKSLIEFFFPRQCAVCKRKLSHAEWCFCPTCFHNMPEYIKETVSSTERIEGEAYIETFNSLFSFRDGNSTQKAIHELKYNRYRDVGKLFGRLAAKKFHWTNDNIDWVLPVPISRFRKAKRGYNQAMEIAKEISINCGLKVSDNILSRKIERKSQTKRDKHNRQLAVKGKFICKKPQLIKNKSILIVDDVLTSGATISEVAAVIARAGAKHIHAFTTAVAK